MIKTSLLHLRWKPFLKILIFLFLGHKGFSQSITVSGTVKSQGEQTAIPGVNILVKNSLTGTSTDAQGKYSIAVAPNAILVFSGIGFLSQEVSVNNRSTISITLQEDTKQLNELVVVGYGTQKRAT